MEIPLKPNDVIQCRECGYRILYKKRTRRTYTTMHQCCLSGLARAKSIKALHPIMRLQLNLVRNSY
ncbi:hypothetical protein Pyn_13276 [Prunus yedoensis var. nudiflora]|uniref:DNA-directed RNA polymerases II IV and V subunit 12 n=1 Tax=Prunus yedoensis var. nudiflora TaxID=2094558 RepID=A0A315AVF2_PRUYE|nr:hypothetical protein Pyn_13276 [Prunus yedoensis var. nudiflora]